MVDSDLREMRCQFDRPTKWQFFWGEGQITGTTLLLTYHASRVVLILLGQFPVRTSSPFYARPPPQPVFRGLAPLDTVVLSWHQIRVGDYGFKPGPCSSHELLWRRPVAAAVPEPFLVGLLAPALSVLLDAALLDRRRKPAQSFRS